jgi:hypothetical protein
MISYCGHNLQDIHDMSTSDFQLPFVTIPVWCKENGFPLAPHRIGKLPRAVARNHIRYGVLNYAKL